MGSLYDKYWSQTHAIPRSRELDTSNKKKSLSDPDAMLAEVKEGLKTDREDALQVLNAMVEDFPKAISLQLAVGDILSEAGEAQAALAAYRNLVQNDPLNHKSYLTLGAELLSQKQYDEAEKNLLRGLALTISQSSLDLYNAALCLRQQQLPMVAVAFCRKALLIDADADTELLMADCLFEVGRYQSAATHYENATACQDPTAHAFVGFGRSLEMVGKYEDAILALQSAESMDADDPEAYASLSRCLAQVGQDSESQEAAAKYAQLTAPR